MYVYKTWDQGNGAMAWRGAPFADCALTKGDQYGGVVMDFNASKSNSIYSDSVSKPTVDGIFGLCLIRAYQS